MNGDVKAKIAGCPKCRCMSLSHLYAAMAFFPQDYRKKRK